MWFRQKNWLILSTIFSSHCLFAQDQPLHLEINVSEAIEPELNQVSTETHSQAASLSSGQFLRKIDGVSSGRKAGKGFEPIIRGQQQSQLNILLGGAQVTSACPGRMDPPTSYASMVGFDRIHVSKGYSSVTDGSGGSGGAVYFERNTPDFTSSDFVGRVGSVYRGNINAKSFYSDMAMGKESGYLRVYGEYQDAGNYKDGSGNAVSSAFHSGIGGVVIAGDISDTTQAEFSLDVSRDRDIHFAGNGMDSPYAEANIWQLKVNHDQQAGIIDEHEWRVFYSDTRHLMDNYTVRLRNPSNPDGMKAPSTAETFGGRWMATIYQGAKDWRFGIDYRQNRQNAERLKVNRTNLTQSEQALLWPGVEQQQWGLFSELDYQFDLKNQFRAGLRFDGVDAQATKSSRSSLGESSPDKLYDKYYGSQDSRAREYNLGAMAGWSHLISQHQRLELRVSRSVRTADATERFLASRGSCCHGSDDWVGNPKIKPEQHHQFDATYHHGFSHGAVTSTLYLDEVSDYILRYQPSSGALLYRNTDARIYGAELAVNYEYHAFRPSASINWTRGVNKTPQSAGDKNLPQIPALLTRLRLDYENQHWMLGSLCEFAASQNQINSSGGMDAGETPGFGVCHLHGRYQLSSAFRFQGGVENLFDKTYAWHVNRANRDPLNPASQRVNEPGRQFWLGAELLF